AHVSDLVICAGRTSQHIGSKEGITIFLIQADSDGLSTRTLHDIAKEKTFEVVLREVKCKEDMILGIKDKGEDCLEDIISKAAVGICAMMVGAGQKVLEMVTDYAKQRHQFGRPIGSFQAVQHHCANMLVAVDSSKFITYKAAWKISQGLGCKKEASIAKVWVNEAYNQIVRLGHQVFGGVGYISEHDMSLFSRRAKIWQNSFGDEFYHRKIVARELGI
ncbi:MAG: acyl-CoA dehydrogenase, partial [Candidatus Methanomethylicaceae archaeon]